MKKEKRRRKVLNIERGEVSKIFRVVIHRIPVVFQNRQSPLLHPASYSERLLCGVERPIDRLD